MPAKKVNLNGNTIIDLTQDTAVASDVAEGKTFHLADGTQAVGTAQGGGGGSSEKFNQMVEKTLTELTAEDLAGVTYISDNAFMNFNYLVSVVIPSNVTMIGYSAFASANSMSSLTIENGIEHINDVAFMSCNALTNVTIPSSVLHIGAEAFYDCQNLVGVTIEATTPPTLSWGAFNGTSCVIYVPEESLDLYKNETNWSEYASRIYPIGAVVDFHRLDLTVNDSTYGYLNTDGGNYIVGSDIWLEAYQNPEGQFVNWTENGVEISTDMSFNYTMPDHDVTLVANFQARSLDINTGNYTVDGTMDYLNVSSTPNGNRITEIYLENDGNTIHVTSEDFYEYIEEPTNQVITITFMNGISDMNFDVQNSDTLYYQEGGITFIRNQNGEQGANRQ